MLLLFILACIAIPQANANYGRMLRVPPAMVLQIEATGEETRYADMTFGFTPHEGCEDRWLMLLIPRSIMKLPDASRGYFAGPGQRRWEIVLQMN